MSNELPPRFRDFIGLVAIKQIHKYLYNKANYVRSFGPNYMVLGMFWLFFDVLWLLLVNLRGLKHAPDHI